jgi:DNA-directed RNA polymerase specialized sigma24 family protein
MSESIMNVSEPSDTCVPCADNRRVVLESFYIIYAKKLGRRLRGAFPKEIRSIEDAEDAVQTTFLSMLQTRYFPNDANLGTLIFWAWKVGSNVVRQKKRASHALKRTGGFEYQIPSPQYRGLEIRIRTYSEILRGAMKRLPPRQQVLIEMDIIRGFPREEIQRLMGIGDTYFLVLRSTAKRRLKEAILVELERIRS